MRRGRRLHFFFFFFFFFWFFFFRVTEECAILHPLSLSDVCACLERNQVLSWLPRGDRLEASKVCRTWRDLLLRLIFSKVVISDQNVANLYRRVPDVRLGGGLCGVSLVCIIAINNAVFVRSL